MPTLRRATPADAALITAQRHQMFADNDLATEETFARMDLRFEPWVREHLADGRYVGLFLEEDVPAADPTAMAAATAPAPPAKVIAAAGIFYMDFPPHFLDVEPCRAYLLNFYTAPEARGRGYARQLLEAAVADCHARGVRVITLHASRFGKPVYEKFGFLQNNEMILKPTDARAVFY